MVHSKNSLIKFECKFDERLAILQIPHIIPWTNSPPTYYQHFSYYYYSNWISSFYIVTTSPHPAAPDAQPPTSDSSTECHCRRFDGRSNRRRCEDGGTVCWSPFWHAWQNRTSVALQVADILQNPGWTRCEDWWVSCSSLSCFPSGSSEFVAKRGWHKIAAECTWVFREWNGLLLPGRLVWIHGSFHFGPKSISGWEVGKGKGVLVIFYAGYHLEEEFKDSQQWKLHSRGDSTYSLGWERERDEIKVPTYQQMPNDLSGGFPCKESWYLGFFKDIILDDVSGILMLFLWIVENVRP